MLNIKNKPQRIFASEYIIDKVKFKKIELKYEQKNMNNLRNEIKKIEPQLVHL